MERDLLAISDVSSPRNFNSHAHVERDEHKLHTGLLLGQISTHTLTWSVTDGLTGDLDGISDFNSHAHVERDQMTRVRGLWNKTFQLTRSRGA